MCAVLVCKSVAVQILGIMKEKEAKQLEWGEDLPVHDLVKRKHDAQQVGNKSVECESQT